MHTVVSRVVFGSIKGRSAKPAWWMVLEHLSATVLRAVLRQPTWCRLRLQLASSA
jgi:hypothetical protein